MVANINAMIHECIHPVHNISYTKIILNPRENGNLSYNHVLLRNSNPVPILKKISDLAPAILQLDPSSFQKLSHNPNP
jgi:hypothetical protein